MSVGVDRARDAHSCAHLFSTLDAGSALGDPSSEKACVAEEGDVVSN